MPILSASDFYDLVISGADIEPKHIDALLHRHIAERTRLEYKAGPWLERSTAAARPGDPTDPAAKLRKYAGGFANGDGGVLVVGVDAENATWSVTGCSAPNRRDRLGEWAARALDEIGVLLQPPPRVEVVAHPRGEILIVGVRRSPHLIPCIESKERVYYIRVYDSTKHVPPYLVHDLLLGRRQHPRLEARLESLSAHPIDSTRTAGLVALVEVQNTSLVWARNIVCGLVGYGDRRGWDSNRRASRTLLPDFRSNLDVRPQRRYPHELLHITGFSMGSQRTRGQHSIVDLAPFETGSFNLGLKLPPEPLRVSWSGAIYFVAEGSPAVWLEVSCRYDIRGNARAERARLRTVPHYERARVAMRRLGDHVPAGGPPASAREAS